MVVVWSLRPIIKFPSSFFRLIDFKILFKKLFNSSLDFFSSFRIGLISLYFSLKPFSSSSSDFSSWVSDTVSSDLDFWSWVLDTVSSDSDFWYWDLEIVSSDFSSLDLGLSSPSSFLSSLESSVLPSGLMLSIIPLDSVLLKIGIFSIVTLNSYLTMPFFFFFFFYILMPL